MTKSHRREPDVKLRILCLVALLLWVVGAVLVGWVFVKGWTMPGADKRLHVLLAPAERDQVLGEMRLLLKAVHGVVTGLGSQDQQADRKQAEQAARSAGMGMAADVNPALMAKLPLPFKQMGMSVHKDFDGLADAIAQGETPAQIMHRLASITGRCTTCHDLYRLPAGP